MTQIAEFFIPGMPRTARKNKGPEQIKWEAHVIAELRRQWGKDLIAPDTKVQLDILFKISMEPTDPTGHGPDLDNLMKPVLDGIAEVLLPGAGDGKNGDFLVYRLNVAKEIVGEGEGVVIAMNRIPKTN